MKGPEFVRRPILIPNKVRSPNDSPVLKHGDNIINRLYKILVDNLQYFIHDNPCCFSIKKIGRVMRRNRRFRNDYKKSISDLFIGFVYTHFTREHFSLFNLLKIIIFYTITSFENWTSFCSIWRRICITSSRILWVTHPSLVQLPIQKITQAGSTLNFEIHFEQIKRFSNESRKWMRALMWTSFYKCYL